MIDCLRSIYLNPILSPRWEYFLEFYEFKPDQYEIAKSRYQSHYGDLFGNHDATVKRGIERSHIKFLEKLKTYSYCMFITSVY